VGWLAPVFPARLTLAAVGPGEALVAIKEQLRRIPNCGMNYGVLRYLGGNAGTTGAFDGLPQPQVSFSYLGDLDQVLSGSPLLGQVLAFSAPERGSGSPQPYLLEITAGLSMGCLQIRWIYRPDRHDRATIEALAAGCVAALRDLIVHCRMPDSGAYTPADFAEFGWGDEYFRDIAAQIERV
jgi:non-ribosomal peptide synthase protein (TIGR01720 family)